MTTTQTRLAEETIGPDEAAVTHAFIEFLKAAIDRRDGRGPRRRFNQARAAACVEAEFVVPADLPDQYRVGLFARAGSYPARIRFANAASESDTERDIRGVAIGVSGISGQNLTPGAITQDFVLNSHPVMMAPDAAQFLELLKANEAGGFARTMYFLTHLKAARIALASRTHPTSHLDIRYWSATPYLFGRGTAVKYVVTPTSTRRSQMPPAMSTAYLHDALQAHLAASEATFDLAIQLQTDAQRMPIEDATVEWPEAASPYIPVARIRIPPQRIDSPDSNASCERSAFNPWHCLEEHRPLGSMNRARREIYRAMAAFRGARSPAAEA